MLNRVPMLILGQLYFSTILIYVDVSLFWMVDISHRLEAKLNEVIC